MANITTALNISPWWIFLLFGYPVALAIWNFYRKTLIQTYQILNIKTAWGKASLLTVFTCLLFGLWGMIGFINYGPISHFLSTVSPILIPGVIIACWPTREWVLMQIKKI